LYDVSTLFFETDEGDGFREPGYSKERRLEPQITIGLLTGRDGFPLMVSAFEGNKGRDQDHAAGHRGVHGRPPAARCHGRG
jgi:transposase